MAQRINLEKQLTATFQRMQGVSGDAFVKQQRIFVGHEKCRMRLVLQHVGLHLLGLALHDVGRIANNHIPKVGIGGHTKGILQREPHLRAQLLGITCGDVECRLRDVYGRNAPRGQVKSQRCGDAAAARTHI